jgi:hypothetical protein
MKRESPLYLKGLERGFFVPPPFKELTLLKLEHCLRLKKGMSSIVKSIAYSLVTPIENRNTQPWIILKRCMNEGELKNIAIDNFNQPIKIIKEIVIIDFNIINCEEWISNNNIFKEELLTELYRINKNGIQL